MREAYRLNKTIIYDIVGHHTDTYALMILYIKKEHSTFQELDEAMKVSLVKIGKNLFG